MKYAPGSLPTDPVVAIQALRVELQKIQDAIDQIHLHETVYVAPARPQTGQQVYADGTQWDPGYGEGPYIRTSTAWVPMFEVDTPGLYYVSGFYPGAPTASAKMMVHVFSDPVTFPAGLTDSKGTAETAATGGTNFDIQKNGVSVGTMTFALGATTATFTFSSQTTFGDGDKMQLIAPGTPDATLAHIAWSFEGTR